MYGFGGTPITTNSPSTSTPTSILLAQYATQYSGQESTCERPLWDATTNDSNHRIKSSTSDYAGNENHQRDPSHIQQSKPKNCQYSGTKSQNVPELSAVLNYMNRNPDFVVGLLKEWSLRIVPMPNRDREENGCQSYSNNRLQSSNQYQIQSQNNNLQSYNNTTLDCLNSSYIQSQQQYQASQKFAQSQFSHKNFSSSVQSKPQMNCQDSDFSRNYFNNGSSEFKQNLIRSDFVNSIPESKIEFYTADSDSKNLKVNWISVDRETEKLYRSQYIEEFHHSDIQIEEDNWKDEEYLQSLEIYIEKNDSISENLLNTTGKPIRKNLIQNKTASPRFSKFIKIFKIGKFSRGKNSRNTRIKRNFKFQNENFKRSFGKNREMLIKFNSFYETKRRRIRKIYSLNKSDFEIGLEFFLVFFMCESYGKLIN